MSTFELLLAFSVLTLTLTAVVSLAFGNLSLTVDTEVSDRALARASGALEDERALAESDFFSASSTSRTEAVGALTYSLSVLVDDLTPCEKRATSTVAWNQGGLRPLSLSLTTLLTNFDEARALGGDCGASFPESDWVAPARFASDTVSPGKPTALDVLNGVVYLAVDQPPYLVIADASGATQGQTNGLFLAYTNGFSGSGQINALDATMWTDPTTGTTKKYVFAATNSASNQLRVYDVTLPNAPVLVASRSLSTCVSGSYPQGWYVFAYGNRLYLTTRYTAGPELHIFDITTPSFPSELSVGSGSCKGFELGDTVEQFVVRDQKVGGVIKRYLFAAADENDRELRVLDVTDPYAIHEGADVDLAGSQDGQSVFLSGARLYFGRLSSSGSDLYIFNTDTPGSVLPQLGSADVGAGVLAIRVAGERGFLATGKAGKEFQVWSVDTPAHLFPIALYNFSNLIRSGLDYESDRVYTSGNATPNLQILYSL